MSGRRCCTGSSTRNRERLSVDRSGRLADRADRVATGKLASARSGDLLEALAADDDGLAASIRAVVDAMAATALDASARVDRRSEAVGLLGFAGFGKAGKTLLTLVEPGQPAVLQVAAVRALGTQRDPAVATALLAPERFGASTPTVRDEILAALLNQSAHVPGVLDAVADGRIPASAVDALRRRQLSQHPDPKVRERAERSSARSRVTVPRSTNLTKR